MPDATGVARFSTETEQFELVGVLQGKVLTLYLDQFATTAPVRQAQMEVESGAWKGVATEVSPAVYTVPVELLAQPGQHPLTVTVQAGDEADLLSATLEVAPPVVSGVAARPGRFGLTPALGWAAATLSLVGLGWLLLRRRQTRPTH